MTWFPAIHQPDLDKETGPAQNVGQPDLERPDDLNTNGVASDAR